MFRRGQRKNLPRLTLVLKSTTLYRRMEEIKTNEYDVLGYRVNLADSSGCGRVSADEIVNLVKREAELIQSNKPNLNRGQIATLVALKMAADKLALDQDFKQSVNQFQVNTRNAIEEIERIEKASHS